MAAAEKNSNSVLLGLVLWVEWLEPDSFTILTEVKKLPYLKAGKTYPIDELIRDKDIPRVHDFFQHIEEGSSTVSFALKIGLTQSISINCMVLKEKHQTRCLWKIGDIEKSDSFQLLAAAAHDLRSPINSILGLSNVLQIMLKDKEPDMEEFGQMVGMIKSSCNHALDFSSDLLELSEIESGNYQLEKENVSINQFIKSFVDTHRLVTLKKGIKVLIDSELEDEITFSVNENKLSRVLSNLLSNATKFSHVGGNIFFRVHQVIDKIHLDIVDEGVGMPPDIVENLFVKFGKSKRIGLNGEKSHGLGMSIVKQIINLHGGRINVHSQEGKGTTVNLIFTNN